MVASGRGLSDPGVYAEIHLREIRSSSGTLKPRVNCNKDPDTKILKLINIVLVLYRLVRKYLNSALK